MAQQQLETSLTLARRLAYQSGIARALTRLGALAWDLDRIEEARTYRQEALQIEQRLGNQVNIASSFLGLADADRFLGDMVDAHRHYAASLQISRSLGHQGLIGAALKGLGMLAFKQGAYAEAQRYGAEALQIFRDVGDKAHIGFALCNLGDVARQAGEPNRALAYYGQYLQIMHEIGYTWPTFYALEDIAALLTDVSRHAPVAARLLGAAHTLRQETGIEMTPEQEANDERVVSTLRQHLGDSTFEQLWTEGRSAPLADLVNEVIQLRLLDAGLKPAPNSEKRHRFSG